MRSSQVSTDWFKNRSRWYEIRHSTRRYPLRIVNDRPARRGDRNRVYVDKTKRPRISSTTNVRGRSVKTRSLPRVFRGHAASRHRVYQPRNGLNTLRQQGIWICWMERSFSRVHWCIGKHMYTYTYVHTSRCIRDANAGASTRDRHTCAREARPPRARRVREGLRSNKFRAGKNGIGGLREIDGATREVREHEGRPAVSGFSPALRSDSDHQTRKSRHPESSSDCPMREP